MATFYYLWQVKQERQISAYKNCFLDFISTLDEGASKKVFYSLDMLKTQDRVSERFVKSIQDGIYELKAEYEGNRYRVFFCFEEGSIVIWFNGFQKKTQKTPESEIKKTIQLKNEYYASKQPHFDKR